VTVSALSWYGATEFATTHGRDYFSEFMAAHISLSTWAILLFAASLPLIHLIAYVGLFLFWSLARPL